MNGSAQLSDFQPVVPREARFQNDDAHLQPSRLWLASAAFPMLAGTLGPVASAFSICALVRQWRQHVPPGTALADAVFVPDPPWLTIVNAVQLAVALVSNAFLLLNMTRRVRFSIAQPITIVGWYISAVCLVALLAAAAGSPFKGMDRPSDEYVWSEAFFYGLWAAILYFVVASLMTVTFWGAASGRYSKDFNLTRSQRTLMLQSIMLLVYLLVGALVFARIEGWHYLDAVYWADVTLFTVGFGDYAPTKTLARVLLFPYALVGVVSLGLIISSIRSLILERGRRRIDARMEEKKRRRTIREMARKGNDDMLTPLERGDAHDDAPPPGELDRRQSEFELMRGIQHSASARRRWVAMAVSTASWLILALAGAAVFERCERAYQAWSYFESVYFCFVSLMTIGYGDLVPVSNAGKSFFVFWSLLALPTMTVLISNAEDTVIKFVREATISLGNVTILPGEESVAGEAKHVARQLTCGQIFRRAAAADAEEPPRRDDGPALAGPAQSPDDGSSGRPPTPARRSLSRIRARLDALPSGHDLHLLLISEIQAVSRHVREARSRRYSFEEWAWFLGLMGEDERYPETHRKALPKERHPCGRRKRRPPHEPDPAPPHPADHERHKWSWVGQRSPLIGSQEESEWILERLMERLRESLWMAKRRPDGVA